MKGEAEVKQAFLVIVVLLAIAALADSSVRSSESTPRWQDQSGKQKGEEKGKDESPKKVSGALGTEANPVRCEDPKGERQYLSRLRCADGKRPAFSRIGSFGVGPYGNILDWYRVKCEGGDEVTVFMDMYHEGYVEKEAVPGFTIVD
jgi:hypothetical protein